MIIKILISITIVFFVLLLQHIIFFLFSKEKNKSKFKEHLISITGASIFIGTPLAFVSLISEQFNYLIILFVLLSSIIASYWFIINPLKYILRPKKFNRDLFMEEEIKSEGYNYKILFTNIISSNAVATGIIPFYKIIIVGNNLKEKLSKSELKAVIYHEIGHHENKHILKLFFINILVQTFAFLIFFEMNKIHFTHTFMEPLFGAITAAFVGLIFVYVPGKVSYKFEYQADAYAAKNYSKIATIDALKKLNKISEGKLTKGNINHPNLEKRLKNIECT